MPIRKRGKGWQVDIKHNGKRLRETVYGSEELAKAWEAELKVILFRGQELPEDKPTTEIRTLSSAYDKTKRRWRGTKGESTALSNSEMVLDVLGWDTPLHEITAERITELIEHFTEDGNSNATINRKTSALRTILSTAKDLEWVSRVPKIPRMKENKHRVVCFDDELLDSIAMQLQLLGYDRLEHLVSGLSQEIYKNRFDWQR